MSFMPEYLKLSAAAYYVVITLPKTL